VRKARRARFSRPREVAIGLGCYAAYLLVRSVVMKRRGRARAAENAARIVALERRLGIHLEPAMQAHFLGSRRRLLGALNVAYVTANIVLTLGVMTRLFNRSDPAYHHVRRATMLGMLAAQPVFLVFPTEPPRKQEHLVDTIEEVSGFDLDSGWIVKLYNPIAAMPSIHMVFAVCTSSALLASERSPVVRALAWSYPPAVAYTVLVTANHFVLDVVAGVALAAAAISLTSPRR
jgi:PAP2 superfamily